MSMWDWLKDRFQSEADHLVVMPVRDEHRPGPATPVPAGEGYFRLWLSEMYLTRDIDWFRTFHPAVNSLIKLQFGNEQVEVPSVAGTFDLDGVTEKNLGNVVPLNYPLTGLMPFNGGVLEMLAGLLAMKGEDYLEQAIKTMSSFSSLIAVPQLSTVLEIAGPLASGVQDLAGATDGRMHLGLHQSFVGAGGGGGNDLAPGYFATIRATEEKIASLRPHVRDDRLRASTAAGKSEPLKGFDYMLFRVECRAERDDYEALSSIRDPYQKALSALEEDKQADAKSYLRVAVIAAFKSLDLTRLDRPRVATAMKRDFGEAKKTAGLVAAARQPISLHQVVSRIPVHEAGSMADLTLEDLLPG